MRALKLAGFYVIFAVGFGLLWLISAIDRMRPPKSFPRDPDQLADRKDWLIRTLQQADVLPADGEIGRVEVQRIKQGEAFRSQLATVNVNWRLGGVSERLSCVAKFAPSGGSLANRAIFVLQANHTREVDLYRSLAPEIAPRAFYGRADPATGNLCLLMEHLDEATEYAETDGCPPEAAHLAMASLARLHAAHWRGADPTPGPLPSFPPPLPPVAIDFFVSLAGGQERAIMRDIASRSWHRGNVPQTVIHGDARVGNMMFTDERAWLIDWQAVRWGRAAFDCAYFMLLSFCLSLS